MKPTHEPEPVTIDDICWGLAMLVGGLAVFLALLTIGVVAIDSCAP